jgi:hypothetical protein
MTSTTHAPLLAHMPFRVTTTHDASTIQVGTADGSMEAYSRTERLRRYQEAAILGAMLVVLVVTGAMLWAH